jgi:hypothetical protein
MRLAHLALIVSQCGIPCFFRTNNVCRKPNEPSAQRLDLRKRGAKPLAPLRYVYVPWDNQIVDVRIEVQWIASRG